MSTLDTKIAAPVTDSRPVIRAAVVGLGHWGRYIVRCLAGSETITVTRAAEVAAGDWRASSVEAPAAAMTGMGIHLTDLCIDLFGEIVKVHALTARRATAVESGDVVGVQLRFATGQTGYLNAILATPLFLRFQVFGTEAWVEARNATHPDTPGPTMVTHCRKDGRTENREFAWSDSVRANLEAFAAAVAGQADYPFAFEEMLHNCAVFEAICRSAETGVPGDPALTPLVTKGEEPEPCRCPTWNTI